MAQTERLMGLNVAARQLITGTPCTKQAKRYKAVSDEYPLYEYRLPGGRVVREDVQAVVHDTPIRITFFLALKDERGKWVEMSFWSTKQIAAECGIPIEEMPATENFSIEEVTAKYGLIMHNERTYLNA